MLKIQLIRLVFFKIPFYFRLQNLFYMPTSKLLVIFSILFLSCNYGQVNKQPTGAVRTDSVQKKETEISKEAGDQKMPIPADTTSSDYLIYLLKHDMPLTGYWTQQLKNLDILPPSGSSFIRPILSRASIARSGRSQRPRGHYLLTCPC